MELPHEPSESAEATTPGESEASCAHRRPARMNWAKLLRRVFELDLEHCLNCGSKLKIIARNPGAVIEKILALGSVGLPAAARASA